MSVFATPQPINATLTTGGARVRIIASERQDTVVRVEPIDSTNRSDVKVAAKTKVEYAAGQLTVATVKSGDKNGSVAITIELPAGSGLALNTVWSDVHADGPLGDCVLNVASGQVQLARHRAAGQPRGRRGRGRARRRDRQPRRRRRRPADRRGRGCRPLPGRDREGLDRHRVVGRRARRFERCLRDRPGRG
jgi:hypothetical protein